MARQTTLNDDFAYIKEEGEDEAQFVTTDPSQTVICMKCGATMKRMSPGPVGGLQNIKRQYTWSCRTPWCGGSSRAGGTTLVRYVDEDDNILDGNDEPDAKIVRSSEVERHPEVEGGVLSPEAYEEAKPDDFDDNEKDQD